MTRMQAITMQAKPSRRAATLRLLGRAAICVLVLARAPAMQAQQAVSLPVVIADFNHDGLPDVLTFSTTAPAATIVFGSVPYGTFSSSAKAVTFPAACTTPFSQGQVVAGDFNGDGLADLFFSCEDDAGTYGVMLGNGDGTFAGAQTFQATPYGTPVLGDFNQDGKLDAVIVGGSDGQVIQLFAGNGDGTFTPGTATYISSGFVVGTPIAADVNGDGYPDLLMLSADDSGVNDLQVFGNNKDGTFGQLFSGSFTSANVSVALSTSVTQNILTGNFYSLTSRDFAVPVTGDSPGVFLVQNTSTAGNFSLATPVLTAVAGLTAAQAGSFTGSGFTDLLVANGTTVSVLANDGTGNFTASYSTLAFSSTTSFLAVADANFDGYTDVYTATQPAGGGLQVAVNLVTGSATAKSQPFSLFSGTQPVSATWAGNVNFNGSTASGTQIVQGVATTTTIASSKNPSNVGDSVTFTAVAIPSATGPNPPTGTMILTDNGTTVASGTVDGTGTFAYTTSALTQGTHPLQATYAGDDYFAGSASPVLSQVVNHAPAVAPTLTWATPAPISFGTPLGATQLDAVATNASGATVPGTFTYLPAAGTVLNAGSQTLQVTFTPSDPLSYLTGSTSVQLTVVPASSTTTLAITSNGTAVSTAAAGTAIALTASFASPTATSILGQVNFCDATALYCSDIHLLGTAEVTSTGTATIQLVPGIGQHQYKAVFLGTGNVTGSSSSGGALTVTGTLATNTTLTQSGSAGNYSLTATTAGAGGMAAPTGTVSFVNQSSGNAVLASAALGTGTSSLGFLNSATPATGGQPQFVIATDLNGDGKPDLIAANAQGNSLTVLLGNGDGTFTAAASPATGQQPTYVAVGDFNADGKPDLAITNYLDGTVSILLGNGDGTFTPASTPVLETEMEPSAIVAGDFNGDGILDLAVTTYGEVTVFLGLGDGTFTYAGGAETGYGPNDSLVAADFNGDGKLDLAVTNFAGNSVSILLGNGDGTFTATASPSTGTGPTAIAAGDFNGDGKPDLAVTNNTAGGVTLLLGNGDGTFTAAASPQVGVLPNGVAVADVNGDGKADLLVANSGNNSVSVLLGNGDWTFTAAATTPATGAGPSWIAAADFNGDGFADFATVNQTGQTVSVLLSQLTQTAFATATGVSPFGVGTVQVAASYPGDTLYGASISSPATLTATQIVPTISWTPAVATIPYGTSLGSQQLDATVSAPGGTTVAGTFTYTPAAGTVLPAGMQTIAVAFTPSSPEYATVYGAATITVTQATPLLTWPTPASIPYGTPLSAAQLNATATGVSGSALAGTFTYTPAAGTVLSAGSQTLNVSFMPSDTVDYTAAHASVTLTVNGLSLSSIAPNTANLGDPGKTITLTGTGFIGSTVVLVNGTAIPTTLVSATSLTANIPATDLTQVTTLQVAVSDPSLAVTTPALPFTVLPVTPAVTVSGPSSTGSGSQPTVAFTVENPYPVPLNVALNLNFAASLSPAVDDPMIQFAGGGRTLNFVVPANTTITPPIQLQSGTTAGTITIPVTLTAGGVNVTPASVQPVVIVVPPAVPSLTSATLTRSGDQLTIAMVGFSNTREMAQATFHFVAAAGAQIDTPDVTVPASTIFSTWYGSTPSDQYGTSFTYTQVFTVSSGAAAVGSVEITLTNTVGASTVLTAQ